MRLAPSPLGLRRRVLRTRASSVGHERRSRGRGADTTALLHWPLERLAEACAARVNSMNWNAFSGPWMLVEAARIGGGTPVHGLEAANRGRCDRDLPRLSTVDLEVRPVLGLQRPLVTDDYRHQNVAMKTGIEARPLATRGARDQWSWVWRCTGCGKEHDVSTTVERKRDGPGPDCDICGSPTVMKRARR